MKSSTIVFAGTIIPRHQASLPHLLKLAAVAHDVKGHGVDDKALPRVGGDLHVDVGAHAPHLPSRQPGGGSKVSM